MADYTKRGWGPSDRAALASALVSAFQDAYGGFTDNGADTVFHFAGAVPAGLAAALQPFTVSASSKAMADALAAIATDPSLDAATQTAIQQVVATLNPASA